MRLWELVVGDCTGVHSKLLSSELLSNAKVSSVQVPHPTWLEPVLVIIMSARDPPSTTDVDCD